jgi:hypothetical protein
LEVTQPRAAVTRRGFLDVSETIRGSYCAFVLAAASVAFGVTWVLLPAHIWDVLAACSRLVRGRAGTNCSSESGL